MQAVQFFYEYHDSHGQWYHTYGLEDWTFETDGEEKGKMHKHMSSINDVKIGEEERWFRDGVDVEDVKIGERHLWEVQRHCETRCIYVRV
jgi:nuclear transport factor 2 (NTF2) superfamily protein